MNSSKSSSKGEIDPVLKKRRSHVREVGSQGVWSLSSCKAGFGVDQLRDDNLESYWQSDGPQPHLVNVQFKKKTCIEDICIYADFKLDESYTPSRISIRTGSHFHDLQEVEVMELQEPTGWIHIDCRHANNGQGIRAFLVQIAILSNHQNGRDTHIRQIKIYSTAKEDNAFSNNVDLPFNFTTVDLNKHTTTISSSYPLPPTLLIQWYSDENISQGLNPEPPAPITDGSYSMFAVEIKVDEPIIRTLEDQDIKRLYPKEYDYRLEIKKMNVSLMGSMLDLLDTLIKCPESPRRQEKCTDIEMLFIQMHHLLNEMRPHQARETIRVKLDRQKKQRLDMINKLETQIEEVIEMVNSSINSIPDIVGSSIDLTDFMDDDSTSDKEETDNLDSTNNPRDEQIDQVTLLTQLDFLMCDIVDNLQVEAY